MINGGAKMAENNSFFVDGKNLSKEALERKHKLE